MMYSDFFQPSQPSVQVVHSGATIVSASVPLVTVMRLETAVMAAMRLTAPVSY